MNFGEIEERVKSYILDLPEETDELVPDWINQAVREAEDRYNFRHMEATIQVQTVVGVRELTAPNSRYKAQRADPFLLYKNGSTREIDWAPSQSDMLRQFPEASEDPTRGAGAPQFLLEVYDEYESAYELHVYPLPDGNSDWANGEYRVRVPYWRYSVDLVDGGDTNFFTLNAPFYLIYRATSLGCEFNRDEQRGQYYLGKAEGEYQRIVGSAKRAKVGRRDELTIRTGVNGPAKTPRLGRRYYRRL